MLTANRFGVVLAVYDYIYVKYNMVCKVFGQFLLKNIAWPKK